MNGVIGIQSSLLVLIMLTCQIEGPTILRVFIYCFIILSLLDIL